MSNLLDRMVTRARAPLRRIEPLLLPRYAPAEGAQSPLLEVSEEREAPVREKAGDARPTPEADIREVTYGNADTPGYKAVAAAEPQAEETPGFVNRRETAPATSNVVEPERVSAASRSDRLSADEPPRQSDAEPEDRQFGADLEPRSAAVRGLTSSRTLVTALTARHPGRAKEEHLGRQAEITANGNAPEVTISIGHIEVRAAQPAEPPRRAPFKPRVSLEDFLKQQERDRR